VNEAVQDGRTGILTKPDPRELADASIRLLLDHDARRVLGAHARRRAVEKFSAGRQVERLLALYTDLLTGRRPAGAGGG
jgi:glycosyltransferase involved in cell wall biosynthesis